MLDILLATLPGNPVWFNRLYQTDCPAAVATRVEGWLAILYSLVVPASLNLIGVFAIHFIEAGSGRLPALGLARLLGLIHPAVSLGQ